MIPIPKRSLVFSFGLTLFTLIVQAQNPYKVTPFLNELDSNFPSVRDITISNLGNEAYFTAQSPMGELSAIVRAIKKNSSWDKMELASFSGQFMDLEPFLTNNGLRLYFASNRPNEPGSSEIKDFDIWYVDRKNAESDWSAPINLGKPINTIANEFYLSLAQNGNLYFTSDRAENSKGKDDIFFSKFDENHYQEPISLDSAINSEGYEFNAFISPDEAYLLFTGYSRADGHGSGDLYISMKNEAGDWQKAVNLGDNINSDKMDYCPFVDQNNMLYFSSKRSNVKPNQKKFKDLKEFLEEINKSENGLGRIYRIDLSQWIKK